MKSHNILLTTEADGIGELLLRGAGTTVEDKEDGLVILGTELLLHILLMLAQKLGVELDVSRLVDTVNIAETSSN